jgi:hypothetical protein
VCCGAMAEFVKDSTQQCTERPTLTCLHPHSTEAHLTSHMFALRCAVKAVQESVPGVQVGSSLADTQNRGCRMS